MFRTQSLNIQIGFIMSWLDTLSNAPKYFISKATPPLTKIGLGGTASIFILFQGLIKIIAQSAHVSPIRFFNVIGGCQKTGALGLFALWDIV